MNDKFIEDKINEKIEEKVNISFDYSEIKDDIDLSAYVKESPAPKKNKSFNFALFTSLAAAALAVVIAVPIIAFAVSGGAKGAMKAENGAANDAAVNPADCSTDVGAGYNDVATPDKRDSENNNGKASGYATESVLSEGPGGMGEASSEVQKDDSMYYEVGEWSCKCKEAEGIYVLSADGTAKVLTDDGVYRDLTKNVHYQNADGTYWFMDGSVFSDGERVIVQIATEVNPENESSTVKVGEDVYVKKITQYVSKYDKRTT